MRTQHEMLNAADGISGDAPRTYRITYKAPRLICAFNFYLLATDENQAVSLFRKLMPDCDLVSAEVR